MTTSLWELQSSRDAEIEGCSQRWEKFVIPEMNMGAKSCCRVDGTATEAEKTEELYGCRTGQWGGH